jgi:DNA-binding CsgD family transcriptional regulator
VYRFWLMRGFLTEGGEWIDRLLVLPGAAVPTEGRGKALNGAVGLAAMNGKWERVLSLGEEAADLWRAFGDDARLAYALNFVASATSRIGSDSDSSTRSDKARGLLEEALGLAQRSGDRVVEAMILQNLGEQLGDLHGYAILRRDLSEVALSRRAAAQPLFERALAIATEASYPKVRIHTLGSLAMISYGTGDLSASRQQAENALAVALDAGDKQEMGFILLVLGCTAADQGERDRAREVIAEAVELGALGFRSGIGQLTGGSQFGLAGCALALAHLAATVGRLEEVVLLDTAVATWLTTRGAIPTLPHPHIHALLDQRVATGRTLGQSDLDRAVARGQAMSLAEAVAEVLQAQALAFGERSAEAPVPSGTAAPDGLTARELEVLRLVASGRSNREIADELTLSVRTVERHVTNLYAKIGARGKADATAYAFRHSLT